MVDDGRGTVVLQFGNKKEESVVVSLRGGSATVVRLRIGCDRSGNVSHDGIEGLLVMFTQRHAQSARQHHEVSRQDQTEQIVFEIIGNELFRVLEYL